MKRTTLLILTISLAASGIALAGEPVRLTENFVQEYPLDITGSLYVENPVGDVEVIGTDVPGMQMSFTKVTNGIDRGAVKDAHDLVRVEVAGDGRDRAVRTVMPMIRSPRWSSSVSFQIRVPRTVHVQINANISQRIHVVGIMGNVQVKNFSGTILLEAILGSTIAESVNGKIIDDYSTRPSVRAQLSTVNNDIEVRVPADSSFDWAADTINGDFYTTLPVRGRFNGSSFRGSVNSPGGPLLTTASATGKVWLLRKGSAIKEARSIRNAAIEPVAAASGRTPIIQTVQLSEVQGDWIYSAQISNISVGKIGGAARVETTAGEIELGSVFGQANVVSLGGPLNLGDILGTLIAHTEAGDIFVRAAREGGTITTNGGNIRVVYAGGPTTLRSGGGDILVSQAMAPIVAETRSGDITLGVDPNVKTQHIEAKTTQGNVVLNVGPRFAADLDATIVTSNPDSNALHTELRGLNTRREQVGGKTHIHTTGKINGGGEKVELYVEEGDIYITTQTVNPITVMNPR